MVRRHEFKLELRCYPKDDRAFLDDAQRAVAECREHTPRVDRLLAAVQQELAARYPSVTIHPRLGMAAVDADEPIVWYVYRDGSLVG